MTRYGSYLNCKEYVKEVKEFLSQFFEEKKDKYSHDNWVTFLIPNTDFKINLLKGDEHLMTQYMVFEIYCDSKKELEEYAKKYNCEINSFVATETREPYRYYYIEIFGPKNICMVEINYCEDVEK